MLSNWSHPKCCRLVRVKYYKTKYFVKMPLFVLYLDYTTDNVQPACKDHTAPNYTNKRGSNKAGKRQNERICPVR